MRIKKRQIFWKKICVLLILTHLEFFYTEWQIFEPNKLNIYE